jgi:integrase/recombinase XerD
VQLQFDPEVSEFLSALKPSTCKVYSYGLALFQEFYEPQGYIKDFLTLVELDLSKPRSERRRTARNSLNAFIVWLQNRGYTPKSIRAYVAAIQSLARYFDIPISLRYVLLPSPQPISKKHPWTIEEVGKFVSQIKKPIYRSLAASIVQSGLSLSDLLNLTYGDVKDELERDIAPLCLDLARLKTNVPFMTFLGSWAVKLLKEYLDDGKTIAIDSQLYPISHRAIDSCFSRIAIKFAGAYEGNNPFRPHSLRAAFRTLLSDHKVDPLYIEFWMGHQVPEQQRVYISKSQEGWRQTYREQAEPWLTPH